MAIRYHVYYLSLMSSLMSIYYVCMSRLTHFAMIVEPSTQSAFQCEAIERSERENRRDPWNFNVPLFQHNVRTYVTHSDLCQTDHMHRRHCCLPQAVYPIIH